MADFRHIRIDALKWFPQSRSTVPVTPVRVQTPPCPSAITRSAGRYSILLSCVGHPVHPQFVEFLRGVELHALKHAKPRTPDLRWFPCLEDSLVPVFKLSAFDDIRFYDAHGDLHPDPTSIEACACLCELSGAWTTDSSWGLRWKVLEVKEVAGGMQVPCMLD